MINIAALRTPNPVRQIHACRKISLAARGLLIASLAGGLAIIVAGPAAATLGDGHNGGTFTSPIGIFIVTIGGAGSATSALTPVLNAADGTVTATGDLASILVSDQRGTAGTWTASASYTGFQDSSSTPSASAVTYTVSEAALGNVNGGTAAAPQITALSAVNPAAVFHLTFPSRNTTTWNPSLEVKLAATALSGSYSGVVTYSFA